MDRKYWRDFESTLHNFALRQKLKRDYAGYSTIYDPYRNRIFQFFGDSVLFIYDRSPGPSRVSMPWSVFEVLKEPGRDKDEHVVIMAFLESDLLTATQIKILTRLSEAKVRKILKKLESKGIVKKGSYMASSYGQKTASGWITMWKFKWERLCV